VLLAELLLLLLLLSAGCAMWLFFVALEKHCGYSEFANVTVSSPLCAAALDCDSTASSASGATSNSAFVWLLTVKACDTLLMPTHADPPSKSVLKMMSELRLPEA